MSIRATLFIGVDVASGHLDACTHGHSAVHRLDNTRPAIQLWLRKLPAGTQLAMESTGRYHQLLAELAVQAGLVVYVLNPRDVRAYANGLGQRGKTDRLDAQVLARYVAHEHAELRPWQPLAPALRELQELLCRRAVFVSQQQALRMSLSPLPCLASVLHEMELALAQALKQIDALVQGVLKSSQELLAQATCVTSVPGLGPLNTAALLSVFGRLKDASADAVIAFLGMDLRPRDSGNSTGQRHMSKRGQPEFRRLLFNAARSAARTSVWAQYYQRELAKGLAPVQAANILARRLVRVAFSLFKSGQLFDPTKLSLKTA
jgi:transposase